MSKKLSPAVFYESLVKNYVEYFCGVPDSSLRSFGHYLEEHAKQSHDIAVNEGSAVALGIGYYLASGKIPLVYMQNSGLGNAINPLASLADPLVMGVPILMLIGWRGQPGKKDEPQHAKQGAITISLLESLDITHSVLAKDGSKAIKQVHEAMKVMRETKQPHAFLVESDTFDEFKVDKRESSPYSLSREEAIKIIIGNSNDKDMIIATTGKASRELFEYRDEKKQGHEKDLLVVGGMGHASAIAYGIAKQKTDRNIFVIDGDGAALMHMGSLPFIGAGKLKNLWHIVINNGAHESVGGQKTVAFDADLSGIARASGYAYSYSVSTGDDIANVLHSTSRLSGPFFIEIKVNSDSRPDLTRPSIHPSANRSSFMRHVNKDE